jgi:hypothetical protein
MPLNQMLAGTQPFLHRRGERVQAPSAAGGGSGSAALRRNLALEQSSRHEARNPYDPYPWRRRDAGGACVAAGRCAHRFGLHDQSLSR